VNELLSESNVPDAIAIEDTQTQSQIRREKNRIQRGLPALRAAAQKEFCDQGFSNEKAWLKAYQKYPDILP
jgi:hypothetical protein